MIHRLGRKVAYCVAVTAACFGQFCLSCAADTQQLAVPRRVGVVQGDVWPKELWQGFQQGLLDEGYAEGRDLAIERRSGGGDFARGADQVSDLVQRKVEVIVVNTTRTALVAKHATATIPIVMVGLSDPVGSGLVASLARPGGNITGLSMMHADVSAKRLQLLKEAIPGLTHVAVMWNPDTPPHAKVVQELKAAAAPLSLKLTFVSARTLQEIGPAFSAVNRARAKALYVLDDAFFWSQLTMLFDLGARARIPVIYWQKEVAHQGGLMSYAPDSFDMYRHAGRYVGRILKGAKPADLPIEQPTKFELVVNLKTAKALGITIPESILLRADEVIR